MNTVQLEDFCSFVQGGRNKKSSKDFVQEGYPAYGAGGLNGFLPDAEFSRSAVVLSAIGARCGKCFLAEGQWSSMANTQIIFPDDKKSDIRFLWYQLNDESRWPRKGVAQPFIRPSDVKTHKVFLPSLSYQKKAASILEKIDIIRGSRERSIDIIASLKASIFVEMFGEPVSNPKGLPTSALHEVVSQDRKITYGILKPGPDITEGIPYIRVVDIKNEEVILDGLRKTSKSIASQYTRSSLKSGDLLISIRGHVGRMAIVPAGCEGYNITQDTARLAVSGAETEFVQAQLETTTAQLWMARRTKGAAVKGINLGDLRLFPLLLPPIAEQREFTRRTQILKRMMTAARRQQVHIESLFHSMRQRAFEGQL